MYFTFIANAAVGNGLSGSDRIFIELAKQWSRQGNDITVCVWEDGYEMCVREGLNEKDYPIHFQKWLLHMFRHTPLIVNYPLRVLSGILYAIKRTYKLNQADSYIYSCSDFWQDAIPAVILKIKYPNAKLIGSFYLAAPNPFVGFYEGQRIQLPTVKSVIYWLLQQSIVLLFRKYADIMFVTSEPDAKYWKRAIVIKGGVNVEAAKKFTPNFTTTNKKYDAVFLGRFHPQKGVIELIDIWKKVVEVKPNAQLIMIGDGPLKLDVEQKVQKNGLTKNVILKGFVFDGEEKYSIFKSSKIVVHPAVYDSGGMAAAEAMAWGLPGVSFDLEALKTYYPKGMIKVSFADIDNFSKKVIELLDNQDMYSRTAKEARTLVLEEWDWNIRATKIISELTKHKV